MRKAYRRCLVEESNWKKKCVIALLFANDLMLVSEEEDVERNLSILEDVMAKWKMKIKGGRLRQ